MAVGAEHESQPAVLASSLARRLSVCHETLEVAGDAAGAWEEHLLGHDPRQGGEGLETLAELGALHEAWWRGSSSRRGDG